MGMIEERRGIRVDRKSAYTIEPALGMASKSIYRALSAYTFVI